MPTGAVEGDGEVEGSGGTIGPAVPRTGTAGSARSRRVRRPGALKDEKSVVSRNAGMRVEVAGVAPTGAGSC